MKVRILWSPLSLPKGKKQPFNGEYIDFERVPNKLETLTFSNITYEIKRVDTEIRGFKFFYTIYVDYYDY